MTDRVKPTRAASARLAINSLDALRSYGDVWIDIESEIGRTSLTVRQLLELDQGSFVKLSRSAGENIDVLVGGVHVGQAEIVMSRGAAAIRLAELREEE
jgi:flagellar motor switch protein FliN